VPKLIDGAVTWFVLKAVDGGLVMPVPKLLVVDGLRIPVPKTEDGVPVRLAPKLEDGVVEGDVTVNPAPKLVDSVPVGLVQKLADGALLRPAPKLLDDAPERVVPNPNELDGCDVLTVSNLANEDNKGFIFIPHKALLLNWHTT
jgi:hypothetical protein